MVAGFAYESSLKAKVALKDDIPIDIPGRPVLDPNEFSNFLKSKHSTLEYQTLLNESDQLQFGPKKRKSFQKMFEAKPLAGHEILNVCPNSR